MIRMTNLNLYQNTIKYCEPEKTTSLSGVIPIAVRKESIREIILHSI